MIKNLSSNEEDRLRHALRYAIEKLVQEEKRFGYRLESATLKTWRRQIDAKWHAPIDVPW